MRYSVYVRTVTVTEYVTAEVRNPDEIVVANQEAQRWEEIKSIPVESKVVLVMPA